MSLQFAHPQGRDPYTTQFFGSGDDLLEKGIYYNAFPVSWKAQSNVHALLLNDAGRLVYFGTGFEYAIDAYAKIYLGAAFEYSLGAVVPFDIDGTLAGTTSFGLAREALLSFGSSFAGTGAMGIAKEVIMETDAAGVLTGAFGLNYEIALTIAETLFGLSGFGAQTGTVVVGQEFGFGDQDRQPFWAFNARTFAPSRYAGLDVQSLGKIGNAVYGLGPGGIYELTGDDDAGNDIAASFATGREDFGVPNVKRVVFGYITGTSDNKLQVRVIDDEGRVYTYETERALGDKVRSVRFKTGQGLKMHQFQWEIRNKAGGGFEVHSLDLLPEILKRRVK